MKNFTVFYNINILLKLIIKKADVKMYQNYLKSINQNLHSLTIEQLQLLFDVYFQLNYHCNFFMTEDTYKDFINFFIETPCKNNPRTYKTLITLLITQYTPKENYLPVLEAIEMILSNYPLTRIINTLYHDYKHK